MRGNITVFNQKISSLFSTYKSKRPRGVFSCLGSLSIVVVKLKQDILLGRAKNMFENIKLAAAVKELIEVIKLKSCDVLVVGC